MIQHHTIQYRSVAKNAEELRIEIEMLLACEVLTLHINPALLESNVDVFKVCRFFQDNKGCISVQDNLDFAQEISADVFHILDSKWDIGQLRKIAPELKIGATAQTLVECKNWELQEIDYLEVCMGSSDVNEPALKSVLGSELLANLIPSESEYGWKLLSLNTPVFACGFVDLESIQNAVTKFKVKGVVISHLLRQSKQRNQLVNDIRAFFNEAEQVSCQ